MLTHSGQAWGWGEHQPVGEPLPGKGPILEVGLGSDPQQLGQGGGSAPAGGGGERERESTLGPLGRREFRADWASPVLCSHILNLASTTCRHSLLSIPTMLYLLPSGPFTGLLTALLARLLHQWLWF